MQSEMQSDNLQGFRLSPQQRRLWTWQQSGADAFRAQCAVRIEGNLDARKLKDALGELVARHEILRTTFNRLPGMSLPLQVVADAHAYSLREYDLTTSSSAERERRIETLFDEASRLSFEFERGPLFQVFLIDGSPSEHVLILSLSSLIADAASLKNLIVKLGSYYSSLSSGATPADDNPLQYADLAEWQNELLESEETGREYWRGYWRKLNAPALLRMRRPFEHRTSPHECFSPRTLSVKLDPALSGKIETLARTHGTSISTVLMACWQTLLWRLTGEPDILVGYVAACRKYEELLDALGLFAKTLPAVTRFDGDLRWSELLKHLHQSLEESSDWQEYFTADELSAPGREPSFIPFTFDFEEEYAARFADLRVRVSEMKSCADPFALKLTARRHDSTLSLTLNYDAARLRPRFIARLARMLSTLVVGVCAGPSASVSRLPLLDPRQRRRLLRLGHGPLSASSADLTPFHHLFSRRAAQTPDAVAAEDEDAQVTYAELDRRPERLARYLRE